MLSEPKAMYTGRSSISTQKYNDLNGPCVKEAIPVEYHEETEEYFNLPHSNNVIDRLNSPNETP